MSGERTEQASEQRKQQTRDRGDLVLSRDLISSTSMLASMLLLRGAASTFPALWKRTFLAALDRAISPYDTADGLSRMLPWILLPGLFPLTVVLAGAFCAAAASGAVQTGSVQIHMSALFPGVSRLNPAHNLKGIFSARSLVRFAKSLLPAAILIALAAGSLKRSLILTPVYGRDRLPLTLAAAYSLAMHAAWISLAWALLDYWNERRMWNSKLKMSKDELRQEHKESNGNPQIKSRIRQIQRSMRRRRVKADVSRAAVVVTNPTHYAVALEFNFSAMSAPRVLTKGRDLHALEIREEARWAGVPIVENPPLARSLYRSVEAGQHIPFELYTAVAAILAYLFRESQQRAGRATQHRNRTPYEGTPRVLMGTIEYQPDGAR